MQEYYFGNDAQRSMQRTAFRLWPLLRHHPDYSYAGRFVGFDVPEDDDLEKVVALAEVQGATIANFVPTARAARLETPLRRRGLATDRWEQLMGEGCGTASAFLNEHRLPAGYRLIEIGPESDDALLDGLAATAGACGVNPPAGQVLRGHAARGLAMLVATEDGTIAACAGAVAGRHPDSPFADTAWWGMLATAPAHRGRRLAAYLGALAMVAMTERHGIRRFYTGVRHDNVVSQRLCAMLGLQRCDRVSVAALDPAVFGTTALTK